MLLFYDYRNISEVTMQTTIEHIQAAELPPFLQKRLNVTPQQFLKITVEVEESKEEYDLDNLGGSLIEGMKEILAYKKGEIDLPDATEVFKSL